MQYSLFHLLSVRPQIAFPYAQDSIPTSLHVAVLRLVKSHAFTLSGIRAREPFRVTMPVVPIKLNNQPDRRDESINAELFAYEMLGEVCNLKTVKNCVSDALRFGHIALLLFCIQSNEHCMSIRVIICTLRRTIEHTAKLLKGCRFPEGFIASFASIFNFVSTLPFIRMLSTAKVYGFAKSILRDINLFIAYSACMIFACFTMRTWGFCCALRRAKSVSFLHSFSNGLSAPFTCDCANTIVLFSAFTHGIIITQLVTACQKPIALAEWAFEKYGSEQDIIFDPFLGSGISVIAAEKMPGERKVIGCELSPDYINIILSRWEKLTGQQATLLERAEETTHA